MHYSSVAFYHDILVVSIFNLEHICHQTVPSKRVHKIVKFCWWLTHEFQAALLLDQLIDSNGLGHKLNYATVMRQRHHFIRMELDLEFLHDKNPLKLVKQLHCKTLLSQIIMTLHHQTDYLRPRQPAIRRLFSNLVKSLNFCLPKDSLIIFLLASLWRIKVQCHLIYHCLLLLVALTWFVLHETWLVLCHALFLHLCCLFL